MGLLVFPPSAARCDRCIHKQSLRYIPGNHSVATHVLHALGLDVFALIQQLGERRDLTKAGGAVHVVLDALREQQRRDLVVRAPGLKAQEICQKQRTRGKLWWGLVACVRPRGSASNR